MSAVIGTGTRGLVRALLPSATPAATSAGRLAQLSSIEGAGGRFRMPAPGIDDALAAEKGFEVARVRGAAVLHRLENTPLEFVEAGRFARVQMLPEIRLKKTVGV